MAFTSPPASSSSAGGIFINEMKNIIITVVVATSVISGDLTLGMMLAVQYIIGQFELVRLGTHSELFNK